LIAALRTQRERFDSAAEVQAYTGIAPVVRHSGDTRSTHCRPAYPHFLRQTFHEWAAHSIMKSEWAREYYEQQLTRGNKHHAAVRSLAFKWIRILFRCWKDRVPYDGTRHREALKKRRSPIAAVEKPVVNLEWKTVAGFLKISADNS
jgi:Transposase IS116/IS110/IS902 family